jgi:thioesterase domain-containing protein
LIPHLGCAARLVGVPTVGVFLDVPPLPSLEAQAASVVDRITRDLKGGPFAILGYSMGGKVAYETAIQLSRMGHQPLDLVIIDSHFEPDDRLANDPNDVRTDWVWDLFFKVYFRLPRIQLMEDEAFRTFLRSGLRQQLRLLQGYIEVHRPLGQLENISYSDLEKLFRFHYSQCLSVSRHEPQPSSLMMTYVEACQSEHLGQSKFWMKVAGGGTLLLNVKGTHTSIFYDQDNVRELARCLRDNVSVFREV